ncbi:amidase [Pseudonocardia aurantiaca]|uniref:Amidase n=1 Tax=Pseudonocardia aurantiaca TaxID=75290 RepID=A0ABW4FLZ1_9PSEU
MSLWRLPAAEQARGIRAGEWSAEEVMRSVLDRIAQADPDLRAYCTLDDSALDAARRADTARRVGEPLGPLHGVPFSVKDLIPTAGVRTTLGSVAHRDWVPAEDEIAVARLRAAGAVLVGKTNARELGYGVVTDNALFGSTRNPWDPRLTAAGSSGGAAAAVAAGMGSLALGSDGGGSLRVPAAVCGVFSIKPTFGVVPLYPSCRAPLRVGLDSWESLECIGPMSRTVADSALVLEVIAGFDAQDRHSAAPGSVTWGVPDAERARGLRVAYSPDLGIAEVAPEVAGVVRAAVTAAAAALDWDLTVVSPRLPALPELRETFLATVAMDTDRSALRRLADEVPVSADIRELVDRDWTAHEFDRARVARRAVHDAVHGFSAPFDLLLTPATAATAFPAGLRFPRDGECGIADGRQWSPFAFLANLTGQPAASIPAGRTAAGLPVGLQALAPRFGDPLLLDVAQAVEELRTPASCFA